MSIFECKALTKNYGAKTVLDSIDLTIERRQGPLPRNESHRLVPARPKHAARLDDDRAGA